MRKKSLSPWIKLSLILLTSIAFSIQVKATGHEIKIRIIGLKDTICYLGNHFGDKQYITDTVRVDKDGWAVFKGKDSLPGGIYLVIMPNKTYFEILVNEQKFTIETDTVDFVSNYKVTGSLENKLFNEHQKFIVAKSKESLDIKNRMEFNKDNKDSAKVWHEKIAAIDKEVKAYRIKLMNDYPQTFIAKIFKTMSEPEVPEMPKDANGNITDSTFAYRYFKSHYWDNVDFSDERLLRTPILQNKIKTYTTQLTPQIPDSIIVSLDTIIEKSKANKEVFKYCVATLTNYYENSKIMGFDKIFVHLSEKYYLSDLAYWADSTLKAKIHERVEKIKPNILFTPAHDLAMPDSAFVMHTLYGIKTKYTVLAFWDPTCGHCKIEIPKLLHYYDSLKTKKSIEVFAVGIESDMDVWKKYIRENKLDWINVSDLYNQTGFRNFYDIYSTPVIYLLDDRKRIIAKRLDADKLSEFIENIESGKIKLPQ
jgi:thiol-disulfide isomerase/thioredoxin